MVFYLGRTGSYGPTIDIPAAATTDEGPVTLLLLGGGNPSFTVTDARMTPIVDIGYRCLYWCVFDGDTTPISFSTDSGVALLAAYRSSGVSGWEAKSGSSGTTPAVVALPQLSSASQTVAASMLGYGIVDGSINIDNYLFDADSDSTAPFNKFTLAFHSWEGERGLSPSGNAYYSGSNPNWNLIVMRLNPLATVAPPCRLFPRADGLGVGSGRHYPPSKSQQRSGRRFGYY